MNFYRTARSFIGRNFVRPFENFCALNRPEVYDYIFYRLRNTTSFEDCGDALLGELFTAYNASGIVLIFASTLIVVKEKISLLATA